MLDVTVSTATARDRHGDPTATASEVIQAIGFAPSGDTTGRISSKTSDDLNNSQARVVGVLYFPEGTRHFPESTVFEFRDHPGAEPTKWGLDGVAADWVSPWDGWAPGVVVHVKRATG